MRDLARVALFDGNLVAGGEREVNGRDGRGDVEGDVMLARQHRHHVGADLVGRVAVGGDAVGSDDDAVYLAPLHHVTGHVVGDDGDGNLVLLRLPRGETCALKEGACLVGDDGDTFAGVARAAHHAEGGAVVARGGERARVAV